MSRAALYDRSAWRRWSPWGMLALAALVLASALIIRSRVVSAAAEVATQEARLRDLGFALDWREAQAVDEPVIRNGASELALIARLGNLHHFRNNGDHGLTSAIRGLIAEAGAKPYCIYLGGNAEDANFFSERSGWELAVRRLDADAASALKAGERSRMIANLDAIRTLSRLLYRSGAIGSRAAADEAEIALAKRIQVWLKSDATGAARSEARRLLRTLPRYPKASTYARGKVYALSYMTSEEGLERRRRENERDWKGPTTTFERLRLRARTLGSAADVLENIDRSGRFRNYNMTRFDSMSPGSTPDYRDPVRDAKMTITGVMPEEIVSEAEWRKVARALRADAEPTIP